MIRTASPRQNDSRVHGLDEQPALTLELTFPRSYNAASHESVRKALQHALDVAVTDYGIDTHVIGDADKMAQLMLVSARPSVELVEERTSRIATINQILQGADFLTGDMINAAQSAPKENKSSVASDWKRRGRIFGVLGNDGKEYFPRYQFDLNYQPLPVIRDILAALGPLGDTWKIAAWFHFPNGWIGAADGAGGAGPLAPKEVLLTRGADLLVAARNQRGTYAA